MSERTCLPVFSTHHYDQPIITHLTSARGIEGLRNTITYRSDVATAIFDFEVKVTAGRGSFIAGQSMRQLRAILNCLTNVKSLILQLPPSWARLQVLPRADVYSNLVLFKANIPHAALVSFLQNHPHIEILTLGPCNANADGGPCPLSDITNSHIRALRELTCPPSCVRAVAQGSQEVGKLFATYDGIQGNIFPICKLLDFNRIWPSANVTILHLDYDHTAVRLLKRIAAAAPGLISLKLTESKYSNEVCQSF